MNQNVLLLAAVPVTGFIAGFINTLAGTGSLITLPLLIFLGLPATVANGTNRVGLLMQNLVAVATFRSQGALDISGAWKLVVPAVVGSVLGARLAVDIDQQMMRHVIGVLMLVMLGIMLLKPERWIAAHASPREPRLMVEVPLFFTIGVYGGFLQAGVGILLLAALVLGAGQAAGACVAARVAIKRGAEFVRIFVIVTVLLSALALFAGFG